MARMRVARLGMLLAAAANGSNTPKLAIVLDGVVVSAVGLVSNHFGGNAQIVDKFTVQQVNELIAELAYGVLPGAVTLVDSSRSGCAT